MKQQIILFLKHFTSIEDGTNKDIKNSKIEKIYFNPKFYKAFIKAQYIKKNDRTFRGCPFIVDYKEGADYWGMDLSPIKDDDNFLEEIKDPIIKMTMHMGIEDSKKQAEILKRKIDSIIVD